MTLELLLPALPGGAAKVLRWLAGEGEAVAAGAPLVIVLTERAEVLLPAPAAGALRDPAEAGATVEPGGLLARIAAQVAPPELRRASQPELRATPLARSIALAHGIDLTTLPGTGPHGRIRAADVRTALPHAPTPPLPIAPTPPLPHAPTPLPPIATATLEFDAGPALDRLAALGGELARLRLRAGLAACVVEAAAAALPAHPAVNARWGEEALVLRRRAHIAAAQPGGGGLRWAVVRDAGDLTLRGVARALGAGGAYDLAGATFAVVCLAEGSGWQSAPPPLPGTAAALAVGEPAARAVAVGDAVAVRPVATLTLSYDARVLDHRQAAAFLAWVRERLERAG